MKRYALFLGNKNIVEEIILQLIASECDHSVTQLSDILKDCIKYEDTCKLVTQSNLFMRLTDNFKSSIANTSSQTFFIFMDLMKSTFECAVNWLNSNYVEIKEKFDELACQKQPEGNAFIYQILIITVIAIFFALIYSFVIFIFTKKKYVGLL